MHTHIQRHTQASLCCGVHTENEGPLGESGHEGPGTAGSACFVQRIQLVIWRVAGLVSHVLAPVGQAIT